MIFALVITKKHTDPRLRGDGPRIRCPKCAWEPSRADRWCCFEGCGHVWNTFETRGVCPGCGKQWTETVCLRCNQWSPHDDWYVDAD
jgi:hypothetical protein